MSVCAAREGIQVAAIKPDCFLGLEILASTSDCFVVGVSFGGVGVVVASEDAKV